MTGIGMDPAKNIYPSGRMDTFWTIPPFVGQCEFNSEFLRGRDKYFLTLGPPSCSEPNPIPSVPIGAEAQPSQAHIKSYRTDMKLYRPDMELYRSDIK